MKKIMAILVIYSPFFFVQAIDVNIDEIQDTVVKTLSPQRGLNCSDPAEPLKGPLLVSEEDLRCLIKGSLSAGDYEKSKRYLDNTLAYLTPAINNAMNRYGIGFEEQEIEVFLSQLFHESGSFMYSTEIGNKRYYSKEEKEKRNKLFSGNWEAGSFCSEHEESTQGGKRYFDNFRRRFACFKNYSSVSKRTNKSRKDISIERDKKGRYTLETSMRKNSYPSRWRGRGLIQLTHCINYLSYAEFKAHLGYCEKKEGKINCIEYANQKSKGKFLVESTNKEISFASRNLQCSEEELTEIIQSFNRENKGLSLDEGDLLTNPYRMADICKPQHMVESAAWFWKKDGRSCSDLATGRRTYGGKSKKRPCRCDLSGGKANWNAKYVRNPDGSFSVDSAGEPIKAECRLETKSGRCGDPDKIRKGLSSEEIIKVSGASRCINGAYCNNLEHRAQLFRKMRDYFKLSKTERAEQCK